VPIPLDQLPDNPDALKRVIAAIVQEAVNAQAEIAKLRFQLARYQSPRSPHYRRLAPRSAITRGPHMNHINAILGIL
jgi:hypothetical protein